MGGHERLFPRRIQKAELRTTESEVILIGSETNGDCE